MGCDIYGGKWDVCVSLSILILRLEELSRIYTKSRDSITLARSRNKSRACALCLYLQRIQILQT